MKRPAKMEVRFAAFAGIDLNRLCSENSSTALDLSPSRKRAKAGSPWVTT